MVVFEDLNDGSRFLTKSTAKTKETIKWEDGTVYPLVKVHITSASHPFYTGQEKLVDVEGRVDKFKARQIAAGKAKAERQAKLANKKPSKVSKQKPRITLVGNKDIVKQELSKDN